MLPRTKVTTRLAVAHSLRKSRDAVSRPTNSHRAPIRWWHAACALVLSSCFFGCAGRTPISNEAILLGRLGAEALSKGDLDTAVARLSLALEYHPNFVEGWINLGLVDLARGNFDAAERRMRRALSLDGDAALAYVGLGVLAERRRNPTEAEAFARKALAIDPGLAEPRLNLVRLLVARGALDEARDHGKRLIEANHSDPAGYVALCEVLFRLERDAEAEAVINALDEVCSDCTEGALLRGRLDLRKGAFADAETRFSTLTTRTDARGAPQSTAIGRAALGWLAFTRLLRGNSEGAAKAARVVLAHDPQDALALFVLGKITEGGKVGNPTISPRY